MSALDDIEAYASSRDSYLKAVQQELGTGPWSVELPDPEGTYRLACEAVPRAKEFGFYETVYDKFLYSVKADIIYGVAREDDLKPKFVAAVPTCTIVIGIDESFVEEGNTGFKARIVDGKLELMARAKRFNRLDFVYSKIMADLVENYKSAPAAAPKAASGAATPAATPAASSVGGADASEFAPTLARYTKAIQEAFGTGPWTVEIKDPEETYRKSCEAVPRAKEFSLYETVYEKFMFKVQADLIYDVAQDSDLKDSFVSFVPTCTIVIGIDESFVEEGNTGFKARFVDGKLELMTRAKRFNRLDFSYVKIMAAAVKLHRGDKEPEGRMLICEGGNAPWTGGGGGRASSAAASGPCKTCNGRGKRPCHICKGKGSCKKGVNCGGSGYLKVKCMKCNGSGRV